MASIHVYVKVGDPYSMRLLEMLRRKKLEYRAIYVDDEDPETYEDFINKTGQMELPAVTIDGQFIGDYEEISRLDLAGKFDDLLD